MGPPLSLSFPLVGRKRRRREENILGSSERGKWGAEKINFHSFTSFSPLPPLSLVSELQISDFFSVAWVTQGEKEGEEREREEGGNLLKFPMQEGELKNNKTNRLAMHSSPNSLCARSVFLVPKAS